MKFNPPNSQRYLILILILFIFSSCSVERELARQFVEKKNEIKVMLLPTNIVYKTNLKTDSIKGRKQMSQQELDSALFVNSLFLNKISDSVFLEKYFNSLIKGLESYGISVYLDNRLDTLLFLDHPVYMVNVAQLQLEEYVRTVKDSEVFGDYEYFKEFNLNAININSWFEVSRVNDGGKEQVLYVSDYISDNLNGDFKRHPLTLEVEYFYDISTMELEAIYEVAEMAGRKYARLLFDHFMNEYIEKQMPGNAEPIYYFHYDPVRKSIRPASESFIYM